MSKQRKTKVEIRVTVNGFIVTPVESHGSGCEPSLDWHSFESFDTMAKFLEGYLERGQTYDR